MIAVLNTSMTREWATRMSDAPWPLLPVVNRPLLDYWMETCADAGADRVYLILGEGAKAVEDFIGSGDRWRVRVEFTFAREGENPLDYLKSISAQWRDGLIYFGGPFFPRRRQAFRPEDFSRLKACRHDHAGEALFLFGRDDAEVAPLLNGAAPAGRGLERIHVHPYAIADTNAYYELNMKMVMAEFSRYVTAGFSGADGSSVGYNTRTPPSSHLAAPLIIGDDCRFGAMTTVGPNAVVGNHVIVDAYTELTDCLILDDTYVGRNLEIRDKIVAGNRVIDPKDGTVIEIDDSWLVARNRPEMKTEDVVRYVVLWCVALGLAAVQLVPFLILMPIILLTRIAAFERRQFHDPTQGYVALPTFTKRVNRKSVAYRLFRGLSLDRFPWLLRVLSGGMFLCGQPPMRHPEDDEIIKELPRYYPGVFCYQDYNRDSDRLTDSLWYAHIRSMYEDVKILIKALITRFVTAGRQ